MKPADSDEMYFGMIDQLIALCLNRTASIALGPIVDKHSVRYLYTAA
jgi:hypothetical protein